MGAVEPGKRQCGEGRKCGYVMPRHCRALRSGVLALRCSAQAGLGSVAHRLC